MAMKPQTREPMPSPFEVSTATEGFLDHLLNYRGLSPLTAAAYRRDLSSFARFLSNFGFPLDVREVETKHIQLFANSLSGRAPATVRRCVYAISSLLRHLTRTRRAR